MDWREGEFHFQAPTQLSKETDQCLSLFFGFKSYKKRYLADIESEKNEDEDRKSEEKRREFKSHVLQAFLRGRDEGGEFACRKKIVARRKQGLWYKKVEAGGRGEAGMCGGVDSRVYKACFSTLESEFRASCTCASCRHHCVASFG